MATNNIQVAVRVRPLITREIENKQKKQWHVQGSCIYQVDDAEKRVSEPYAFDHIFTEVVTNKEIYESVVRPLVDASLQGFNATIFSYGQTSSGKTFTLSGDRDNPGIMQNAISHVFNCKAATDDRTFLIRVSYIEIYNEVVNDLLDISKTDLRIREDVLGIHIDAKEELVVSAEQAFTFFQEGNKNRKIGCTNMNEKSSRSHTIFRLLIESRGNSDTAKDNSIQISQLNFIDLAGSERISQTKAQGDRRKEGVHINKSLLTLSLVIRKLSECPNGHVNYRDSKLTRVLQQALGGNSKTLVIAAVTPASGEETNSTLCFLQQAKAIKNKPKVNEVVSDKEMAAKYAKLSKTYKAQLEEVTQKKEALEKFFSNIKFEERNEPNIKKRRHTLAFTPNTNRILGGCSDTVSEFGGLARIAEEQEIDESFFFESRRSSKPLQEESPPRPSTPENQFISNEVFSEEVTPRCRKLREDYELLEKSHLELKEFTKLEQELAVGVDMKDYCNMKKSLFDLEILYKDQIEKSRIREAEWNEKQNEMQSELGEAKKRLRKLEMDLEAANKENIKLKKEYDQVKTDSSYEVDILKERFKKQETFLKGCIEDLNKELGKGRSKSSQDDDNQIALELSLREALEKAALFEAKNEALVKKLRSAEQTISDNDEKIFEYLEQLSQEEAKRKKAEEELEKYLKATATEASIDSLEAEAAKRELEEQLRVQEDLIKEQEEVMASIKAELEEKNLIIDKKQEEIFKIREETASLKEEKDKQMKLLEEEKSRLENELELYKTQLDNTEQESKNKLIEDMNKLETEKQNFCKIVDQLQKELQKDKEALSIKVGQLRDLEEILKSTKGEKEELIESKNEAIRKLQEDKALLQSQIIELENETELLKTELKTKSELIEFKEEDDKSKKEKINNLEVEKSELSKIIDQLQNDIDNERKVSTLRIEELEGLIGDKTVAMDELQASVVEKEKIIESITNKLVDKNEADKNVEENIKKLMDESDKLQLEVERLQKELDNGKMILEEKIKQIEKNQELISSKDSSLAEKTDLIKKLQTEIELLKKDKEHYHNLHRELLEEQEKKKKELDEKMKEIEEIEENLNKLQKDLYNQNEVLKEDLKEARSEISRLRNNAIQHILSNSEEDEKKDVLMENKITELEKTIESLTVKENENAHIILSMEQKIKELKDIQRLNEDENGELQEILKKKEIEIENLKEELHKINSTGKDISKSKQDFVEERDKDIEKLKEEIEFKEKELRTNKREILKLKTDLINSQMEIAKIQEAKEREIVDLKNKLSAKELLEIEFQEYKENARNALNKSDIKDDLEKPIDLKIELERANQENKTVQSLLNQKEQLEVKLAKAQQEVKDCNLVVDNLKATLSNLQKSLDEKETLIMRIKNRETAMARMHNLESVEKKYKALLTEIKTEKDQIQKYNHEKIDSLKLKIGQMEISEAGLKKRLEEVQQTLLESRATVVNLHSKKEAAEGMLKQANDNLHEALDKLEEKNKNIRELKKTLMDLKNKSRLSGGSSRESSCPSTPNELSPNERRKQRRHAIQDSRRSIGPELFSQRDCIPCQLLQEQVKLLNKSNEELKKKNAERLPLNGFEEKPKVKLISQEVQCTIVNQDGNLNTQEFITKEKYEQMRRLCILRQEQNKKLQARIEKNDIK